MSSEPLTYNGIGCQRPGCTWTGNTVRDYEEHVREDHS